MTRAEIQAAITAMRDGSPEAEAAADAWQRELDAGTADELDELDTAWLAQRARSRAKLRRSRSA